MPKMSFTGACPKFFAEKQFFFQKKTRAFCRVWLYASLCTSICNEIPCYPSVFSFGAPKYPRNTLAKSRPNDVTYLPPLQAPNGLGFSTVSASTEALVTTTQEQSKRGTCKRAKGPERKLSAEKRVASTRTQCQGHSGYKQRKNQNHIVRRLLS